MFSKLRRITPEEVEDAFRKYNYKPTPSKYLNTQEKKACGIGILALVANETLEENQKIKDDNVIKWVGSNFHPVYDRGFGFAFRGNSELSQVMLDEDRDGILQAGFEDGQAIRKHLIQVGLMK